MGGCGCGVVGWITKNGSMGGVRVKWLKSGQFCLKIYDLTPPLWVDGWFSGSINCINLELIEIIQFCLKIYDL